jgi:hypothetical protein
LIDTLCKQCPVSNLYMWLKSIKYQYSTTCLIFVKQCNKSSLSLMRYSSGPLGLLVWIYSNLQQKWVYIFVCLFFFFSSDRNIWMVCHAGIDLLVEWTWIIHLNKKKTQHGVVMRTVQSLQYERRLGHFYFMNSLFHSRFQLHEFTSSS